MTLSFSLKDVDSKLLLCSRRVQPTEITREGARPLQSLLTKTANQRKLLLLLLQRFSLGSIQLVLILIIDAVYIQWLSDNYGSISLPCMKSAGAPKSLDLV